MSITFWDWVAYSALEVSIRFAEYMMFVNKYMLVLTEIVVGDAVVRTNVVDVSPEPPNKPLQSKPPNKSLQLIPSKPLPSSEPLPSSPLFVVVGATVVVSLAVGVTALKNSPPNSPP